MLVPIPGSNGSYEYDPSIPEGSGGGGGGGGGAVIISVDMDTGTLNKTVAEIRAAAMESYVAIGIVDPDTGEDVYFPYSMSAQMADGPHIGEYMVCFFSYDGQMQIFGYAPTLNDYPVMEM